MDNLVNVVVIEFPRIAQIELLDLFQDLLVRLVKLIRVPVEEQLRPDQRPVLVQMAPQAGVANEWGRVVNPYRKSKVAFREYEIMGLLSCLHRARIRT